MGLLGKLATGAGDLLSGGAISAGREQRKGINKAMGDIRAGYGAGMGNINTGYDQAQGQLNQGYGQARGDLAGGFGQARSDLSGGMANARGALQPLAQQTAGAYGGLLSGYNSGKFDANNFNFEEDPGFNFALNKGLDSVRGSSESMGLRGSGDEKKALMDYATGAASQQYGDAFNRNLAATGQNFNQGSTLASPAFGLAGQLSGLYSQEGQGLSDLSTQQGYGLAGLSSQQGLQGAGLSTGRAGLLSGLNTEQGVNLGNMNMAKGAVNGGIQQAGWSPITNLASQAAGKLLGGMNFGGGAPGAGGISGLPAGLDPKMLAMMGIA